MTPRRPEIAQERIVITYDHPEAADADHTALLWKVPPGRSFRLDRATYVNPTGLAAHNDNFADLSVKKGSTKMAAWSTDGNGTGINGAAAEGTIDAATFVTFTKHATDANLVAAADDVISFVIDESGTTTVPAGRLVIEGRLI